MDEADFDALTRSLNTAGSRRRALGGLIAGTLGLLGAGSDSAMARKQKACPPC